MVSIKTRKGFNQAGAPPGRSDAATEDGEKETPDKISESHSGSPNAKVKIS